jgi:hypothetical protein
MNRLEKQLQSWTPRRPSSKIARRLFAAEAPAASLLHRREVWHWLTPVAACVLTVLVAVHTSGRREARVPDNATFFATMVYNAVTSNVTSTYALSKMDENMEWNVWPHPFPAQTSRWNGTQAVVKALDFMPTNR